MGNLSMTIDRFLMDVAVCTEPVGTVPEDTTVANAALAAFHVAGNANAGPSDVEKRYFDDKPVVHDADERSGLRGMIQRTMRTLGLTNRISRIPKHTPVSYTHLTLPTTPYV